MVEKKEVIFYLVVDPIFKREGDDSTLGERQI